jgi:hypothetical protein
MFIPLLAALTLGVGMTPSVDLVSTTMTQQKGAKAKAKSKAPAVNVQIMVVHAKEGEVFVDPKLAKLEKHLEFLRYDNFSVLDTQRSPVVTGKSTSFAIEGGRKVTVNLLEKNEDEVRLRVQMFKDGKKLVDTTVRVKRGSTFVVAGPKYKGGILLLPITANY